MKYISDGGLKVGISSRLFSEDIQFFLNTIDKPTVILAPDQTIERVNERFLSDFSYGIGSHFKDIIAADEYEQFHSMLEELSIVETNNKQFNVNAKKGQLQKMQIYMYYDSLMERTTVVMDQSKKYTSTASINWKNLFYHSDSFELILDSSGHIFDVNLLALKVLKQCRANIVGRPIKEVLQYYYKESISFETIKQYLVPKNDYEFVCEFEYDEGKFDFYKVFVKKSPSEALYRIRVIDWTDYTLMQQQLTQKDSLQEVGQLAASIAHEIRNPITTLKGFIQLMKTTADETTTNYLAVINDEVDRMEAILSEMLQLAKPSSLCKDIICMAELLSTIEKIMYPKATYESIELLLLNEFEGEPFILGEEGKLKQVLLNLLKNSMEAMDSGGKLTIQLKNSERDYVTVIIKDTGKGIKEEDIKKVFMPYFTTRQAGTGLGLPFVLKTVEEHEGKISVSSEEGKGTCFIMTFPLAIEHDVVENDQEMVVNK